jgi:leucyl/phenylalanyl-tRNA--protein transferase
MLNLPVIKDSDAPDAFPPAEQALKEPNGLLAMGGALTPERLYAAYCQGIFPWSNAGEPTLWWSPDPRCVFRVSDIQPNRRMLKYLRNSDYRITFNHAITQVMQACALTREDTWIQPEMIRAYAQLAQQGQALSVEVWAKDQLIGGLFGIVTPRVFCGDSMFSAQNNASKIAFYHLVEYCKLHKLTLIDGQLPSNHLYHLGAVDMSRQEFLTYLRD